MKQSFWGLFCLIAATAIFVGVFVSDPAPATAAQALAWCNDRARDATPLQRVGGCAVLIDSKRLSSQDLAIAYRNRGDAQRDLGYHRGAVADYDNAIHLGLPSPMAYFGRGVSLLALAYYKQAIDDFNRAIRIDRSLVEGYLALGVAHQRLGHLELAINHYSHAIRLRPREAAAYNNRGSAYDAMGDLDRAIADYRRAASLSQFPTFRKNYEQAKAKRAQAFAEN